MSIQHLGIGAVIMILACCGFAQEPVASNQVGLVTMKVEKLEKDILNRQAQLERRVTQLEQRLNNIVELLGDNFERGSRFDTVERRLRELERKMDRIDR